MKTSDNFVWFHFVSKMQPKNQQNWKYDTNVGKISQPIHLNIVMKVLIVLKAKKLSIETSITEYFK